MPNPIHEANRRRWDAASESWARGADARGLWRRCPAEPELVLCDRELAYLRDIAGSRVCVLGSGDNQVVFALAGLGAQVTSVDISQRQLDVADRRARELGLAIRFIRADVTDLSAIQSETFDVVYTGGHVAVWVSDLRTYYREGSRILCEDGLFLVSEYHPFRRIWQDSADRLVVEHRYFERGPFEYETASEVLNPRPGDLKQYEFHWSVADYVNAVLATGCRVCEVHEFGEDVADWEGAPMHGLPEFLLIVSRKEPGATSSAALPASC